VQEGEEAKFVAKATGTPTPTVEWFYGNELIKSNDIYKVVPGELPGESTLVIPEVFPEDAGKYTVKAINEAGEARITVVLAVAGKLMPATLKPYLESTKL